MLNLVPAGLAAGLLCNLLLCNLHRPKFARRLARSVELPHEWLAGHNGVQTPKSDLHGECTFTYWSLGLVLYMNVCVCKVVSTCLNCVVGSFCFEQDASEHRLHASFVRLIFDHAGHC